MLNCQSRLITVVSVNRVRAVNIGFAEFERVFVSNPIFESIFAQKQSCEPSSPLQLLFWPKFMFPYEKLSFGWSKLGQNSLKPTVVSLFVTVSAPILRRPPATPRVARAGDPRHPRCVALIRSRAWILLVPVPFSFLAHGSSRARAEPSPAAVPTTLAAPLRFLVPRAAQPRPASTAPVPEPV